MWVGGAGGGSGASNWLGLARRREPPVELEPARRAHIEWTKVGKKKVAVVSGEFTASHVKFLIEEQGAAVVLTLEQVESGIVALAWAKTKPPRKVVAMIEKLGAKAIAVHHSVGTIPAERFASGKEAL